MVVVFGQSELSGRDATESQSSCVIAFLLVYRDWWNQSGVCVNDATYLQYDGGDDERTIATTTMLRR